MPSPNIGIVSQGLVTSAGRDAPSVCAAIRAKLSNPCETRFSDSAKEWIVGHAVLPENHLRGSLRLVKMAALAITECLSGVPRAEWPGLPLFLCIAERDRPARESNLEEELFSGIQDELDVVFSDRSLIFPNGRVGIAVALDRARKMFEDAGVPRVLIVGADSLLSSSTLKAYELQDRLLTSINSNGFMPGEGAAAMLVSADCDRAPVVCAGIGFGFESAHIASGQPLRGEGMARAMKSALQDAGCKLHELDFRVADLSGEQYYFKEAALSLARVLRERKERFDLVQPAESIGETGAVAGLACLIVAATAIKKGYAPGPGALVHTSGDSGQRVALVLRMQGGRT